MIDIVDVNHKNKKDFIFMCSDFYNSNAVNHKIPIEYIQKTVDESINKNPFLRCLIFQNGDTSVGYAILAFTYSNEAGGLVLLIEEIHVKKEFRGKGLGKDFFNWIFETYNGKIKRYRLEVSKSNLEICKFYSDIGFSELSYLQMVMDK